MVFIVLDPVHDRVAHVYVAGCHIDFGPERLCSVGKRTGPHPRKKVKVFLHRAIPIGTLPARRCQSAAILPHLIGSEITDKRKPFFDQNDRKIVELFEVIGCLVKPILPVQTRASEHLP